MKESGKLFVIISTVFAVIFVSCNQSMKYERRGTPFDDLPDEALVTPYSEPVSLNLRSTAHTATVERT